MFDISKLKNNTESSLDIDELIVFDEEILKTTEIKRLEDVKAKGKVSRLENEVYHLTLNITGKMILLCARSLEEVEYPINISIDKNIEEGINTEEKQVIYQNGLDIFSIIWENIVLEVPLRVIKEDATYLQEGDGWSLVMDNKIKNDSPFSELKEMLDKEVSEWN